MNSILQCCTAQIYTSERTLNPVSQFTNISCRSTTGRRTVASLKWHLLRVCVCASITELLFLSTKEQGPKLKKKKGECTRRQGIGMKPSSHRPTWPNNKAAKLCRQRLEWSGLFIGSLWGLLTETHICLTHTAVIKELAVSMKADKEVNILYIITSKSWLIAFKKKKEKEKSQRNNGKWRDKAFFLVVTMVTASF